MSMIIEFFTIFGGLVILLCGYLFAKAKSVASKGKDMTKQGLGMIVNTETYNKLSSISNDTHDKCVSAANDYIAKRKLATSLKAKISK